MQLGIGMLQEVRNHVGTVPSRMVGLEHEASVFLISLSRKTDVVELNFVHAGFRSFLGQGNIVCLYFGLRGVGPYQFAVFAPWLPSFMGLYRQLTMGNHQPLVAKDGHSGNGVHTLRVQEVGELRQVMNRDVVAASEGMVKGNVDASVAILHIENYGISA